MLRNHFKYVALCLVLSAVGSDLQSAEWDYRVGVGYEFISQEFFLDSILGADTLASAALKTTYLDDYKGLMTIRLIPFEDRRLELRASYEQTPEFIRNRFFGDFRTKGKSNRVKLRWELDSRQRYSGEERSGDNYLAGAFTSGLKIPAMGSTSMLWNSQFRGEFVHFGLTDEFSLGFYKLGGKIGMIKSFATYSHLEGNLFLDSRVVPDSTNLNYLSLGGELTYFGFYERTNLDFYSRVERRSYNKPEREDDFLRIDADQRYSLKIGEKLIFRQQFDGEMVVFDDAAIVNFNFVRARLNLMAGVQSDNWSFVLGPQIEFLDETELEFAQAEDFVEYGLKTDFDYLSLSGLLVSVESVTGIRNLKDESDLQSDFRFQRLMIIADARIFGDLRFSTLFSSEWEFHDQSEENNQILLLSTSLTWGF